MRALWPSCADVAFLPAFAVDVLCSVNRIALGSQLLTDIATPEIVCATDDSLSCRLVASCTSKNTQRLGAISLNVSTCYDAKLHAVSGGGISLGQPAYVDSPKPLCSDSGLSTDVCHQAGTSRCSVRLV